VLSSFTAVKFSLLVGITGGILSTDNGIGLGDIVVSKPVLEVLGSMTM
jgi:hypothetical protein